LHSAAGGKGSCTAWRQVHTRRQAQDRLRLEDVGGAANGGLRCHYGRDLYRVLYRRSEQLVILLHIFAKRSARIDPREIRIAHERWEDFKARMDAQPRTPPRAAGHDAP
jgi:phage-related protein